MPAAEQPPRTFMLTLAYDGGAYAGWQFQPGQVTLQDTLERALQRIASVKTRVVASGRTDAGVHALGQVVSFHIATRLGADALQRALNAELPRDMAVLEVREARPGFHAIRDAVRKTYRYVLRDGRVPDVFSRGHAWQVRSRLDAEAMHRAARRLVGRHDFASFETSGSTRQSSVRTVESLSVERSGPPREDFLTLEITADGFLYNMVRTIVGTLVEVGRGEREESWPGDVLVAGDRRRAGQTAPPHGLFLVKVEYPEDCFAAPANLEDVGCRVDPQPESALPSEPRGAGQGGSTDSGQN